MRCVILPWEGDIVKLHDLKQIQYVSATCLINGATETPETVLHIISNVHTDAETIIATCCIIIMMST